MPSGTSGEAAATGYRPSVSTASSGVNARGRAAHDRRSMLGGLKLSSDLLLVEGSNPEWPRAA
jgi:hypothetical protein